MNHIEDGIVAAQNPRNLLDNSDFTNPVNQRGRRITQATDTLSIDGSYILVQSAYRRLDI